MKERKERTSYIETPRVYPEAEVIKAWEILSLSSAATLWTYRRLTSCIPHVWLRLTGYSHNETTDRDERES